LLGVHHEARPKSPVLVRHDLLTAASRWCDPAGYRDHSRVAARLAKLSETDSAGGHGKLVGHRDGRPLLDVDSPLSSFIVERSDAETLSISVERVDLRIIVVVVLFDHRRGGIEPNDTISAEREVVRAAIRLWGFKNGVDARENGLEL
jgi:hypothetical protein